ncbi:uncharacterized protein LOC130742643 [Lotus japonicus]|uniref:uncharacterized protein LOC130742643 n=1 Tax=Lotus japonicus TaxID=34305 RepID=UPI002589F0B3|nr:uncharacterized protein LOC130742643 [Lotus japonicus]
MENNTQVLAKRVWSMIRVAFYMLRKGVTKGKLMMDLNTMLKRRRKLAGKAITNLMFHHHNHANSVSSRQFTAAREYEFSCSNTPNNFFTLGHSNKRHRHNNFFTRSHAQPTLDDDAVTANAVKAVLEMLNNEAVAEAMSPALPGFGRSPMVRQLRVTDSPFPLQDSEIVGEKDSQVDKAADEFIKRFYMELRQQD